MDGVRQKQVQAEKHNGRVQAAAENDAGQTGGTSRKGDEKQPIALKSHEKRIPR